MCKIYIILIVILSWLSCQGSINSSLEDLNCIPVRTMKNSKISGDPVNIIIFGTKETIHKTFTSAGWSTADKLSISKNIRMALDCIFNLSYRKAPVSTLYYSHAPYYLHKPNALIYQLQYGGSPRKRHHVRFWKIPAKEEIWVGAASFDKKVKFNSKTKKFTHQISANVDSERDLITNIFKQHGFESTIIDNFQNELHGFNGEGDYYYTDGKLALLKSKISNIKK